MQTHIPAIIAIVAAAVPLAPVPGVAGDTVQEAIAELAARPSGGGPVDPGEPVFLADPYGLSAANAYQSPGENTEIAFLIGGQPRTAYVSAGASFADAGLAINVQFQATVFRTDLGGDRFAISGTQPYDFTGASPAAIAMLGLGPDQLVMNVEPVPAKATTDDIGDRSQGQRVGERLTSALATIRGNIDNLQYQRIDTVEGQYGALNANAVKTRRAVAVGPETLVGTFPVDEAFNDFTFTFKWAGFNRTIQIPAGTLPEDLPYLLKSPFGGNSYVGFDTQGRIIIVPGEDVDFSVTADATLDYLGLPLDTGLIKSRATRTVPLEARDIAFQGQALDLVLSELSIYSQQARAYLEVLQYGDGSGEPGKGPLADTLADLTAKVAALEAAAAQ
ncbi:hypothetical protein [Methylobacterium sp. Leaf85]|uniref:hypothetical protein n=1 Tax=Methylobacterium sp. Leaf85 TaxID=1736241 RepID=UPI0006F8E971|nr:hypothetical protein [Methylobacterium sp. Leaf85]KQO49756.1 hypothetical protein ASF08_22950 [Methylobacterium sp. Leaf85]